MSLTKDASESDEFTITGRFGGVYVVNHNATSTRLAAKIINLDTASDHQLETLSRTIWTRSMLRHRNLLPLLRAFVEKSSLWMISPVCDLGPASDLCKPYGLSEVTISFIILNTLTALEYLHERGMIHRAVTGSHILLRPNGQCYLTGLGYSIDVIQDGLWRSKIHDFPSDATKCLNWLAPEILAQNLLGYSFKSDVYSLGVTCCELANGIAPYEGLEPGRMLLEKLTGNHPRPIDSATINLFSLPEDADEEETRKYSIYQGRRFSDHLHHFTSDTCLLADPESRPPASQLLKHKFIKQAKKLTDSSKVTSISSLFASRASASSQSNAFFDQQFTSKRCTSVSEEVLNGDVESESGETIDKHDVTLSSVTWEFHKINLKD